MHLRYLRKEDAPRMLLWMHDESVVEFMHTGFSSKTLQDCEIFIAEAQKSDTNIHFAIASDEDVYMGTTSLKCIDRVSESAEFAITVCRDAMGKGYAWFGMSQIIDFAFSELKLKSIYWCVSKDNVRAVRFYEKHGFATTNDVPGRILSRYPGDNLLWFSVYDRCCYGQQIKRKMK